MNIIPYGDTVFVLPDKVIDRTESGIILTDFSKKRPTSGTIIKIGSKVKDFKVGDRIIYGEFAGQKLIIEYGGKDTEIFVMYADIKKQDILALLE